MKKLILAIALPAVLLGACGKSNENVDTVQTAELNERLEMAQDSKDSLIFLMSDIYSGVEEINVQEGLLYNLRGSDNVNQKQEIIENLARIKAELQAKQARLDEMTARFNSTNDKNGQLAKEVARLKELIATKEARITELQAQLTSAQEQINTLNTEVTNTKQSLAQETEAKEQAQAETKEAHAATEAAVNEANKVYYCIGTSKELKARGILEKKFLGKTKVMQGNYDASYFQSADKRSLTVIPCHNKKVKIMTGQPADSYKIIENADGTKSIQITNPARFWNLSDFLVIKVG